MNHARGLWKFDLIVVASLLVAIAFGRAKEADDAAETAKQEKAAAQKKADAKPEDVVWLRLPLECEQFIAMRGAGQQWKRRPVCADLTKQAAK